MKMILPVTITATEINGRTDVPVDDAPGYSGATAYTVGDIVWLGEYLYQCIANTTGNSPPNATYWVQQGKAERYKPFDGAAGTYAEKTGSLYYRVTLPGDCTALALFNIRASTVRVRVYDTESTLIYDETISNVDGADIVDALSWRVWSPTYSQEFVLEGIPGYSGNDVRIDIDNGTGEARVGEIVFGQDVVLGNTVAGTSIGFQDFSDISRDDFGVTTIVERGYVDEVNYQFTVARGDELRVKRLIAQRRATPTVFYTSVADIGRGTMVLGIPTAPDFPITGESRSFCTLAVEGVLV